MTQVDYFKTYKGSPWQKKMHESEAKIKVVWAGRRAGKGRAVLSEMMKNIMKASRTGFYADKKMARQINVKTGYDLTPTLEPQIHIWVVAPSYAQSRQAWNELKQFMPKDLVVRRKPGQGGGRGSGWSEDEKTVWLKLPQRPSVKRTQVFIEIKSADDPESLQTAGPDFIWITEAQDIKEAAWNKLRPMLSSSGRLGTACVEGIPPYGRSHWFSKLYRYAHENPSERYGAFHATSFDNAFLTEEQKDGIQEEKETMPVQIWERMYMAKQPDGGSGFFRGIKIDEAATSHEIWKPAEKRRYVAGLDLGKSQDYTVFIVKDSRTRASVHALEMSGTDWVNQVQTIASEIDRWGVDDVRIDSTGLGDVVFDHLMSAGLPVTPFKFSMQSKYQLFQNYYIALENKDVSFPSDWETLKKQLEDISIRPTGNGGYTFFTESQQHDDWVDAELLALMACDPPSSESGDFGFGRPIPGMTPIRPRAVKRPSNFLQRLRDEKRKRFLENLPEEVREEILTG
jgi:hypothetical protein